MLMPTRMGPMGFLHHVVRRGWSEPHLQHVHTSTALLNLWLGMTSSSQLPHPDRENGNAGYVQKSTAALGMQGRTVDPGCADTVAHDEPPER